MPLDYIEDELAPFNRDIRTKHSLWKGFRAFAEKQEHRTEALQEIPGTRQRTEVFTDRSYMNNGCEDANAGAGAWFGKDDPRNIAIVLPSTVNQSNNAGKIMGILLAVRGAEMDIHLIINSDSQITIDGLTRYLERNEENSWIGVKNKDTICLVASHLRARRGQILFKKVKGHSSLEKNEGADELAKIGTQREPDSEIDTTPIQGLYKTGVKLSTAT